MHPEVKALLNKTQWQKERAKLRDILLESQLLEEVKWGKLCYSYQSSNVALIYGLKNYCAVGFMKGSLMKDPRGLLVKPGEHSQAARWIKFSDMSEIAGQESILRSYIAEAIRVEKSGLKVNFKEKNELVYPAELEKALGKSPNFERAFERLTPGRKRGYVIHFSGAKQSSTRTSRIEKCVAKILEGKGLNDR